MSRTREEEIIDAVRASADEYPQTKGRFRQVLRLTDFTEADLQAILSAEPPQEAAAFDYEVGG